MSTEGTFVVEEDDIVKLLPQASTGERAGYVNIGPYSLHIELDADGKLVVQIHPRGAESPTSALATAMATKAEALASGGTDFDAEEEEGEDNDNLCPAN